MNLDTKETPKWFQIATKEFGQKEILGEKHNQRIIEYHSATTLKATSDEVPWCSSFVSWCLEKAGVKSTRSAWARSYMGWGKAIKKPFLGCIVVFSRGKSSGHVGFYFDETEEFIMVWGGNQSNEVTLSLYPKSRLLGYRVPRGYSVRSRSF